MALVRTTGRAAGLLRGSGVRGSGVHGVRTAKLVSAAVVAYVAAGALLTLQAPPVLAALTALLVVQVTLYDSLASGLRRVAAVVAGVAVAAAVAQQVRLTWWTLGLVVATGLIVGRLLRLRDALLEVPISGMLILAVGGAEQAALDRVRETLVGAAVGIAVHLVAAPPLYVRPAGEAVAAVARHGADLLSDAASGLRAGTDAETADRWLAAARDLRHDVTIADDAVRRAGAGLRLNPRLVAPRIAALGDHGSAAVGRADVSLRSALDVLEHVTVGLRGTFRALADRAHATDGAAAWPGDVRERLATVLDSYGAALDAFGRLAVTEVDPRTGGLRPYAVHPEQQALAAALTTAVRAQARLVDVLAGSPEELRTTDVDLTANLGRLIAELDVDERVAARSRLTAEPPGRTAAVVRDVVRRRRRAR